MKTLINVPVTVKISGEKLTGHFASKKSFFGTANGLAEYIVKRETDELQERIIGSKKDLVILPLSPEDIIELERLESLWTLAEKKAAKSVTCQIFGELAKK